MIRKERYLVYQPESDTLKLNEIEHLLVGELMSHPILYYQEIILKYYNESLNKKEFKERLEEIFLFYYNTVYPVVTPFSINPDGLMQAIEIIKTLNSKSDIMLSAGSNFKQLFKNDSDYQRVIDVLSKSIPEKGYKPWFDPDGIFLIRKDKVAASCSLLNFLCDHFFDQATKNEVKNNIPLFAKDCFNVEVGQKTSNLKGSDIREVELWKRLNPRNSHK